MHLKWASTSNGLLLERVKPDPYPACHHWAHLLHSFQMDYTRFRSDLLATRPTASSTTSQMGPYNQPTPQAQEVNWAFNTWDAFFKYSPATCPEKATTLKSTFPRWRQLKLPFLHTTNLEAHVVLCVLQHANMHVPASFLFGNREPAPLGFFFAADSSSPAIFWRCASATLLQQHPFLLGRFWIRGIVGSSSLYSLHLRDHNSSSDSSSSASFLVSCLVYSSNFKSIPCRIQISNKIESSGLAIL